MSKNARQHDWAVSIVVGASLVGTFSTVSAPAAAQGEVIHVTYEAQPPCPSKERFTAEIGARTALARFSAEPAGARVFRASVRESEGGYEGELSTLSEGVEGAPRRVRDVRCEDVASALALMIAIAVDPQASTAPVSALVVSSPPRPPPATTPNAVAPVRPPSSPSGRPPLQGPIRSWMAGGDALTVGGIAPDVSLGVLVFLETSQTGGHGGAFRFALGYADSSPFGGASPDATMRWVGGRVEACPVGTLLHPTVRVFACGSAELGAQLARGNGAPHPRTETRWASSVELGGRLQWWPTGGLFLEGGGGARTPLLRRTFVFEEPRQVIYPMPRVGWAATLGGGFRFL